MARKAAPKSKRRLVTGRSGAPRSAAVQPDPFRHVVALMLENRSFDHVLGALQALLPDIDGIAPGAARENLDTDGHPVRQRSGAADVVEPDPKHETPNVLNQIDEENGRFVKDFQRAYPDATPPQIQAVMAYHDIGALPSLQELARTFAVCDAWFSSVPGPTWTNRLFAMSGTSVGRVKMPQGVFHPHLHAYPQPSLFRRLREAKRTHRIYYGDFPLALLLQDCRQVLGARRMFPFSRFLEDAGGSEADFPEFAFIEPKYLRNANDDHPPHPMTSGEALAAQVYAALRGNTALWESTLLVVTFDEHGGFYDHASPPSGQQPPDAHREEYTFDRFGVRVPTVLVSPWIERQVVHTTCDHTAFLRSLQRKWTLGDMGQRVATAPDILSGLRLAHTPRSDVPSKLQVPKPRAAARARARIIEGQAMNENQLAIVAFSQYLELQTKGPATQKVRSQARVLASPSQAMAVAEERANRYLAQRGGGGAPTRRRK